MKRKTNFDIYLEKQFKNSGFKERFEKAGEAWDVALKLAVCEKNLCPQREPTQKGRPPSTESIALTQRN